MKLPLRAKIQEQAGRLEWDDSGVKPPQNFMLEWSLQSICGLTQFYEFSECNEFLKAQRNRGLEEQHRNAGLQTNPWQTIFPIKSKLMEVSQDIG